RADMRESLDCRACLAEAVAAGKLSFPQTSSAPCPLQVESFFRHNFPRRFTGRLGRLSVHDCFSKWLGNPSHHTTLPAGLPSLNSCHKRTRCRVRLRRNLPHRTTFPAGFRFMIVFL